MYEGMTKVQRSVIDGARRRLHGFAKWSGQLCLDSLPDNDYAIQTRGLESCVEEIVSDTKESEGLL